MGFLNNQWLLAGIREFEIMGSRLIIFYDFTVTVRLTANKFEMGGIGIIGRFFDVFVAHQ